MVAIRTQREQNTAARATAKQNLVSTKVGEIHEDGWCFIFVSDRQTLACCRIASSVVPTVPVRPRPLV